MQDGLRPIVQMIHDAQALDYEDHFLPEGSICGECGKVIENYPGVERVLAARGYRYYNPDTHRVVTNAPIPFCHCQ